MILELSFNNYRMYKDNSVISFSCDTRTKKLLSNSNSVLDRNVLKTVGLYGQNNIGKTNIIDLFTILKKVFLGEENIEFNRVFFNDTPETDISIIYKTDIDSSWLKYEFTYDSFKHEFVRECLSEVKYYKTGNPHLKTIYLRDKKRNSYSLVDHNVDPLLVFLPFKKPLLYCLSLDKEPYSFLKPYLDSFIAFSNSIVVLRMYNIPMEKTIEVLKSGDKRKKEFVLSFVKTADLSINDFSYSDNMKLLSEPNQNINEEVLQKIGLVDQLRLTTTYGKSKVPSIIFDSSGTKKIEAIASYVYETLKQGKILVVDELDNGLHFKLSRAILSAFNSFANTKAQLVFTAHDIELITCKYMMRKDQVYFSFRKDDLTSVLFCLKSKSVEDGGPRSAEDLLKHYNRGEFGHVPSPNFIKNLSDLLEA